MALATVEDVQARLDRPLTDEERVWAETLLGDAEVKLLRRIPDLLERAAADPGFRRAVVMVESNAVLRVLRNPEGYRQETEGNYGYSLSAAVASGHLFIMDSEWDDLGYRTGAWTITPVVRTRRCRPDPWTPGEVW